MSVDSMLASHGISTITEMCGDGMGGSSIWVEVEGGECDFCIYKCFQNSCCLQSRA